MKVFLALCGIIFGLTAGLYLLEIFTIEAAPNATVFQQLVARISFGFAALLCVVSLGLAGIIDRLDDVRALRGTVNDIALSNADAAKGIAALKTVSATQPQAPVAAQPQALVVGGRLAVEAAMLDASAKTSG
jgi:hypothetical protein